MNIQLSVTIWTVICFVLLMLILRNLLFKPVLRVMDARKERIDKASEKKAAWEAAEKEHSAMLVEKEAEFRDSRQKQIKSEIESIYQNSKKMVEIAQEDRLRLVDEYRAHSETEHTIILQFLGQYSAELAVTFADNVTKD